MRLYECRIRIKCYFLTVKFCESTSQTLRYCNKLYLICLTSVWFRFDMLELLSDNNTITHSFWQFVHALHSIQRIFSTSHPLSIIWVEYYVVSPRMNNAFHLRVRYLNSPNRNCLETYIGYTSGDHFGSCTLFRARNQLGNSFCCHTKVTDTWCFTIRKT